MSRLLVPTLVVSVVLLLFSSCFGLFFPVQLLFDLGLGWLCYLWRIWPELHIDIDALLRAMVCLVTLSIGLHLFLTWLRSQARTPIQQMDPNRSFWKLSWTAAILASVLLMFLAGISTIGIAHQLIWLVTSPTPLFEGGKRQESAPMYSMSNLKLLGLSAYKYQDVRRDLPPGASYDRHGQMQHGWMALLHPYRQETALQGPIDFSVAWNHSNNIPAFSTLVSGYQYRYSPQAPQADALGLALSHYASNLHVIGGDRSMTTGAITDGTSNTLLLGEAAGNYLPWGQPANWRDPRIGLNRSPNGFGNPTGRRTYFTFADGSVRFLQNEISPEVLKALSTPAGGEKVADPDQ